VIAALRSPTRRISFAITVSALMHVAILWLPHLPLAHHNNHLPPLSARLEALPAQVTRPDTKPEPLKQASKPVGSIPAKPINNAASQMKELEKSVSTHQFPKHVMLSFAINRESDIFSMSVLRHELDITGDKYTLKASRQTSGVKNRQSNEQLIQISYGKISEHGLHPEIFKQENVNKTGIQTQNAIFDWATQKLHFSNGDETELATNTQDALSFMYQLSQLALGGEYFPLPISDGAQLEQVRVEIGRTEDISTPMGNLRALHLRKMHAQGEPYFEIWLGLEYRLLPVKIRQIDSSGKTIEEDVISEIRASDED
jgi:hypothetical protein